MIKEITVHSLQETKQFAKKLGKLLMPPDVITLEGDLGAGKTAFTKALATSLGVTRTVTSPTFTIIKQYEGNYALNHLDVYRLANSEEDLGWDELFYGDAISVVEWAHFIEEDLPQERLEIKILHGGNDKRSIIVQPIGRRYKKIYEELFK